MHPYPCAVFESGTCSVCANCQKRNLAALLDTMQADDNFAVYIHEQMHAAPNDGKLYRQSRAAINAIINTIKEKLL